MPSEQQSDFQFSLRDLLGLLTLAGVSLATLQLGWIAMLIIPAIAELTFAIMGKAEVALGILVIMLAVAVGIVGAIVVG